MNPLFLSLSLVSMQSKKHHVETGFDCDAFYPHCPIQLLHSEKKHFETTSASLDLQMSRIM